MSTLILNPIWPLEKRTEQVMRSLNIIVHVCISRKKMYHFENSTLSKMMKYKNYA